VPSEGNVLLVQNFLAKLMNAKMSVGLCLIGAVLVLAACGKVQEQSKGAGPKNNPGGVVVSKWKTQNSSTSKAPMGLVLEEANERITATLYELKGTNSFVVGDKLAAGNYQAAQKAIILMAGNLPSNLFSVEEWIDNVGPYLKIPFERGATNLAVTTVVKNGPEVTVNLTPFKGD